MYSPRQIGIPHNVRDKIIYTEDAPPLELKSVLFCTWELKTAAPLDEDCLYLILPDACADIIFDMNATDATDGAFVMVSSTNAAEINLGKTFHFVGLRFFPGALDDHKVAGSQGLHATWQQIKVAGTEGARQTVLHNYAKLLLNNERVRRNYLLYRILSQSGALYKVSDLENLSGYTRRQLQRIFRQQTGFTPRDFLKILRFQHTLADNPSYWYADQSHLVKEFKRITGLTPKIFKSKY